MKVLTWNVNCQRKHLEQRLDVICKSEADIVALQEVRSSAVSEVRDGLQKKKYEYFFDTFDRSTARGRSAIARTYGVVIASRYPLKMLSDEPKIPVPKLFLSVVAKTDFGPIEIHTAHIPNGRKHRKEKIEMLEAIYKRLAKHVSIHRILCGDFNTPQQETKDGDVITFGQHRDNKRVKRTVDGEPGSDVDAAERSILEGLAKFDLADSFRALNGYREPAHSYIGRRYGKRIDHLFASKALNAKCAKYLHDAREDGLSDHSPLLVEFEPRKLG